MSCVIRRCTRQDLRRLEWDGLFTHHRELVSRTYGEQLAGRQLTLVGVIDGEPCGQICVDFRRGSGTGSGVVWALRVHPDFRRMGVGTRLLLSAETEMRLRGLATAQLVVEAENHAAVRLYGRLGYLRSARSLRRCTYTTREGEVVDVTLDLVQMVKPLGPERKRLRPSPR